LFPSPVETSIEPDVSTITMKYGVTADWASARGNAPNSIHETQAMNAKRARTREKTSNGRMIGESSCFSKSGVR
jgi:hypothetical protein